MSYSPTYNWSGVANGLDDSLSSITTNESVAAIVATLLVILALVIIARRVIGS